ncbi:MAG: FAD-binding oxidoreductase [Pseudomonadota bacterium]
MAEPKPQDPRAGRQAAHALRARPGGPSDSLFADDFKAAPYWHDGVPPAPAVPRKLPASADVVVVGSGYTGLHAAIQTTRGGRSTVVLEAGEPGAGCSTRNGGQISTSIKPSFETLARRFGPERARRIRAEGPAALDWIEDFVAAEGIDCGFRRAGRFYAAHTPRHYEDLARKAERGMREEAIEAHAVPQADQKTELGSDFYAGGVVFPRFATLHPARYHHGLLRTALASGVQVVPRCAALSVERDGDGVTVDTVLGKVRARDVVVATNGYTGQLVPWLRRRVIPIGSYMIATEPLPRAIMDRLFPTGRMACDTRRVVYYYGPSPDRSRVVFGGRVSSGETDVRVSGPRLHAEMTRIFPELAQARISHAWSGFVAYTFDEMAHCGVHDGIHYAMGYCGSGVSMASYLGMRTGQRVLGLAEGRTGFDDLPFDTRPLYTGRPWFLPAAVAWYRWRDTIECARAARMREAQPA